MRIGAKFARLPAKQWRKRKACAVLANRRQWDRDYNPVDTYPDIEIVTGEGYGIRLESTLASEPTMIIQE